MKQSEKMKEQSGAMQPLEGGGCALGQRASSRRVEVHPESRKGDKKAGKRREGRDQRWWAQKFQTCFNFFFLTS